MGRTGEVGAPSSVECCMCGDHGLSSELFTCSDCRFRSQHKYCSNLYPGAESYHICNWCHSQKDEKKGEEITKSSQNSSHKTTIDDHHDMKIKKSKIDSNHGDRRSAIDHKRIKKENNKFPAAGRKRVTSDHGGAIAQRIIKRNRSEEKLIIRPVFRNKVRRYKLLDEVSS